jgi:hypothetical protein
MNSTTTPTTNAPRTVEQVKALDEAIAKCDRLLDRATTRGNLEASIRWDAKLRDLSIAMANVGDVLWGKYCEQLLMEDA